MSGKHRAPTLRGRRLAVLVPVAALAVTLTGTSLASAAPTPAAKPKPAAAAKANAAARRHAVPTVCNISFGGGSITVTLTPYHDDGVTADYSIRMEQMVPRPIHWQQDSVGDNWGRDWRGLGGQQAYGDTQWWDAQNVAYSAGAWYAGRARDSRGNTGWEVCNLAKVG